MNETEKTAKFCILLGAFTAFTVAFIGGYFLAGNPPDLALRDAAIASIVGAILMKGFLSVVFSSVRQLVEARLLKDAEELERDDDVEEEPPLDVDEALKARKQKQQEAASA